MPDDGTYGCCNFYGPDSTTLEYDTADFALSAFAGALGDTADQATYADRAQDWRNVLDPNSGFDQPRDDNEHLADRLRPDQRHRLRRGRLVHLHRDGALRPGRAWRRPRAATPR